MTAAEMNVAEEARALAVLLHPHPHFGGNRLHPFINGLFHRLPTVGITAVRFDFASAESTVARDEVIAILDELSPQWSELPTVLAGYSFGAGIAASVVDGRIAGWYLLAPPAGMLSAGTIGGDPRPKAIVVPEFDQFSPPDAIADTVAGWKMTTVTTLPKADHFLGAVDPVVQGASIWIESVGR
jgi:uncharacterized protein